MRWNLQKLKGFKQFGIPFLLGLTLLSALISRVFFFQGGPIPITFNELQSSGGVESSALIPELAKGLSGQYVSIRGYIHPTSIYRERGFRRFVLARDVNENGGPCDYVVVTLRRDETASFKTRPIELVGRFLCHPSAIETAGTQNVPVYELRDASLVEGPAKLKEHAKAARAEL